MCRHNTPDEFVSDNGTQQGLMQVPYHLFPVIVPFRVPYVSKQTIRGRVFFGSTPVTVRYLSPQMRLVLLLLPFLHLSVASLPAKYLTQPGAILVDISFITNYVEIGINLNILSSFYNTASTYLSLIDQYRHAITSDKSLTPDQVTSLSTSLRGP